MANFMDAMQRGYEFGAQQRQDREKRNRLAEMESLAPQVISGDMGATNRAYTIDPTAAGQYQKEGDRQRQQLFGLAKSLKQAESNPQMAAAIYRSAVPFLRGHFGAEIPEQYDATSVTPVVDQVLAVMQNQPALGTGNNVQSTYINAQGKRVAIMRDGSQQVLGDANQSIRVLEQEGALPYGVVTSGGVAGQVVPLGGGQPQQPQPPGAYIDPSLPPEVQAQIRQSIAAGQEPPAQMVFAGGQSGMPASGPVRTPTAAENAAATERAKLQAQLDYLPQELGMRTEADIAKARGVEQAKSEQERVSNERAKTAQLNNVDRGLDRIDAAIKGLSGGMVDTGPLDGRLMVSTQKGQELEAAVGAIQNDMLALTRVPGIGSQSDLEAKIANLKYPSIYNHPSVNAANVQQLRAFMTDLRRQITGAGTVPAAAKRTIVRTGTSNGRKVIQYNDGSVEYGN